MEEIIASKSRKPVLGKGAIVWLVLCIVVNTVLFALILFTADYSELSAILYLWFVFPVGIIAGYIVLLTGRRLGYLLLAACAVLNVIAAVFISSITFQTIASTVINLFITLAFIGKSWKHMLPIGKSASAITAAALLAILVILTVTFGVLHITVPSIEYDYDGRLRMCDENGAVILEHSDFISVKAQKSDGSGANKNIVLLTITGTGIEKINSASIENTGKRLHIYVGDAIVVSPIVSGKLDGEQIIITLPTYDEARALSKNLQENIRRYR